MKKYSLFAFAFAFLLFNVGFNFVHAYDSGCTGAGPYSTTTGQLCSTGAPSVPGCSAGYAFSPVTGQSCTSISNTSTSTTTTTTTSTTTTSTATTPVAPAGTTYPNLGKTYSDADSAANPHTADFLGVLVYADASGVCHDYDYTGAAPTNTTVPCPSPKPVVVSDPSVLGPYDSSLYGQICVAFHVHMPAAGSSSTKVISPIVCGTAYGLPTTTNTGTNTGPGVGSTNYGQGYTDAESAANPHTADFVGTLLYADTAGVCHYYNYLGASPSISTVPCPNYIVPTISDPSTVSPYDSRIYNATATCFHVHMPGVAGGSSTKVIAPIICGTAYGLPATNPNQNGQPLGSANTPSGSNCALTGTCGTNLPTTPQGTYNGQGYTQAGSDSNPHTSDFLATLVYTGIDGACHFYDYSGSAPSIKDVTCPSPKPVVIADPSLLSPYASSLYGQNAVCMHVHMPAAGSSSTKVVSPIICGTAYGLPSSN